MSLCLEEKGLALTQLYMGLGDSLWACSDDRL